MKAISRQIARAGVPSSPSTRRTRTGGHARAAEDSERNRIGTERRVIKTALVALLLTFAILFLYG